MSYISILQDGAMKFAGAGTQPPQRIRLLQQLMEMGFKVRICVGVLCHLYKQADTLFTSLLSVCPQFLCPTVCPSAADDTGVSWNYLVLGSSYSLAVSKYLFSIED